MTNKLYGAAGTALALILWSGLAQAADELNALVWCDHSDPNLLQPFEEANGVKVNVKEFEGTGAGLAIVEQSQPGDWDVMVIDSIDIRRGVERGLFAELPEDKLPFGDLFAEHHGIEGLRENGGNAELSKTLTICTLNFSREKNYRDAGGGRVGLQHA